jgi:hypothetical protein
MMGARSTKACRENGQRPLLDRELDHLPPEARWREWMMRVEATIFAANEPVGREVLARIVGTSCSIDLLIDDIREELRGRPYDLVTVAGGFPPTPPSPPKSNAMTVANRWVPGRVAGRFCKQGGHYGVFGLSKGRIKRIE